MNDTNSRARGAMSVNDFAVWAGIGRTTAWKEIRERRLCAVKVSARTIVSMEEAQRWLSTRPSVFDNDRNLAKAR